MFQVTLRTARELCGYSLEDVSEYCGVAISAFEKYEKNTELIPIKVLSKIKLLFNVPLGLIYIGNESECVAHNKENV